MSSERPIVIATRGSALALAQAKAVLAQCRQAFPAQLFEIQIFKTTGDNLQTAAAADAGPSPPKGLFTKELEVALLDHQADLAVHSLKDLPTELPTGLTLGAVGKRADVRDVFIYRDATFLRQQAASRPVVEWTPGQAERRGFKANAKLKDFPAGLVVATGSPRRQAQLLALRPDWKVVAIRGNVPTRLVKLAEQAGFDAIVLAAAGLERLNFKIGPTGFLHGDGVPGGLLAIRLEPEVMLPAVGQGAVGIEIREHDARLATICEQLNHFNTQQCVIAERAFLATMGGGCQSPVGAYAEVLGHQIRLRVVSFVGKTVRRGEARRVVREAVELGKQLAAELKA